MVFRSIVRAPFGIFEAYKHRCHTHTKQMNLIHLMGSMTAVMILGQGVEKIVCKHPL
jgi:hypothetical protein